MARTLISAKPTMTAMLPTILLLAVAVGCGGNKTGDVSGIVTFQGKPMPGGFINFYTVTADGRITNQKSSLIGDDGTYSVTKVPIGDVKITVQAPPGALQENMTEKGGMPKRLPPPVNLPLQYQSVEQTDLKYTVTPGKQTHDIELK